MKLRITILPLLIFALFGYSVAKLDQNTKGSTRPVNVKILKADVVEDYHEVKDQFVKAKHEYKVND